MPRERTLPRYDRREPCAQCPYRTDAPLAKWDATHFADLLKSDAAPYGLGTGFACHNNDGNVCIGWALDQRDRGFPSNTLRLSMRFHPELAEQVLEATDGGHERYPSIRAMCDANFPGLGRIADALRRSDPAPRRRRKR